MRFGRLHGRFGPYALGSGINWNLMENRKEEKTRSSWLNCALRDDEAAYWVSIGHYEALAVGN